MSFIRENTLETSIIISASILAASIMMTGLIVIIGDRHIEYIRQKYDSKK
jgi:hypothetical protein